MQSAPAPAPHAAPISRYELLDAATIEKLEVKRKKVSAKIDKLAATPSRSPKQNDEYISRWETYHHLTRRLYGHRIAEKERLLLSNQKTYQEMRSALEAQYNGTREKLDASEKKVDQLTKRLLNLEIENNTLVQNQTELQSTRQVLNQRIADFQRTESRLQKDLTRIRQERDQASRDYKHLSSELELIKDQHRALQSHFESEKKLFETENLALDKHMARLEREIRDLKQTADAEAAKLRSNIDQLQSRVTTMEAAATSAQKKHLEEKAALEKELRESRAAQANLQNGAEKLRQELCKKRKEEMDSISTDKERTIEYQEFQLQDMTKKLRDALNELNGLREENAKLIQRNTTLESAASTQQRAPKRRK